MSSKAILSLKLSECFFVHDVHPSFYQKKEKKKMKNKPLPTKSKETSQIKTDVLFITI